MKQFQVVLVCLCIVSAVLSGCLSEYKGPLTWRVYPIEKRTQFDTEAQRQAYQELIEEKKKIVDAYEHMTIDYDQFRDLLFVEDSSTDNWLVTDEFYLYIVCHRELDAPVHQVPVRRPRFFDHGLAPVPVIEIFAPFIHKVRGDIKVVPPLGIKD